MCKPPGACPTRRSRRCSPAPSAPGRSAVSRLLDGCLPAPRATGRWSAGQSGNFRTQRQRHLYSEHVTVSSMPAVGQSSLADDRGTRRRRRVVRGILPVTVAAGVTYVLVAGGHVPAPVSLAVLGGVLVLVPPATALSRRTALNGSLLIGCAPVLWWLRWPFPVSHAGLVLAVGLGILVGRISASEAPVDQRLRALLPDVRPVDALVPGVGVAALASMWPWAFPGSAHRALVALLPGLDNVAHFHMFSTIR